METKEIVKVAEKTVVTGGTGVVGTLGGCSGGAALGFLVGGPAGAAVGWGLGFIGGMAGGTIVGKKLADLMDKE